MGIDVVVFGENHETISNEKFIQAGFPSANLRHFNIPGWIPKFNDLIGQEDLVDRFATEMRSAPPSLIRQWWDSIVARGLEEDLMASYLLHCLNHNYTLVFW